MASCHRQQVAVPQNDEVCLKDSACYKKDGACSNMSVPEVLQARVLEVAPILS